MNTGNGCYWGKLDMVSGPDRDIVFFVNKDAKGWKVTRATTKRKCRCRKGQDCVFD